MADRSGSNWIGTGSGMLTKQCNRCRKIIPFGITHCEACTEAAEKQKAQTAGGYDRHGRDKRSMRFYRSKEWRLLSQLRLQVDGYRCKVCGEIATEVHHIIPIKKNWDKRLTFDNTMSVCTGCHNKLDR